ncbi:MAG: universal stress protein [Nitrospirota bacterium]
MKIKHILFPTDFSEGSEAAVDYVKSLAAQYSSKVTLLYVIEEFGKTQGWYVPHISLDEFYKEMEANAKKKLEHCSYEEMRDIETDRVVLKGRPDEEILNYADSGDVDLIVMGTQSKSGMDILFGSTAIKVLRKSKCPVFCVKVPPAR